MVATLAGRDAALAYWRSVTMGAPGMLASDPALFLRQSEKTITTPEELRLNAPRISRAAVAVLRDTPLSVLAMRQLGVVESLRGGDAGMARIALAERISRRDLHTELLLIEADAQRAEAVMPLQHYDRALSVYPLTYDALFPAIASELTEPAVRRALVDRAGKTWVRIFVVGAANFDATPEGLSALYAELEGKVPLRDLQEGAINLLRWLANNRQYAALPGFAARVPGLPVRTFEQFGFSAATTDMRFTPLSWSLRDDGVIEAGADGNGLIIRVAPENAATAATRMTLLAPGTYRLTQSVTYEADAPRARLGWQFSCLNQSATPVWQQDPQLAAGPAPATADFTVPPDCPAQIWQLQAAADVSQFASVAKIAGLALARQ